MRMTRQVRAVLGSLRAAPEHTRYGYEVIAEVNLTSGSVYPILRRLEAAGWLESREDPSPLAGRPSRRSYWFTELGLREAAKILDP